MQTIQDSFRSNMFFRSATFLLLCAICANGATVRDEIGNSVWKWSRDGNIPCIYDAVEVGLTSDNWGTYLSRVHDDDNLVPGFLLSSIDGKAFINYENKTQTGNPYEILCSNEVAWQFVNAATQNIPIMAFPVGNNANGNNLYACRAATSGEHASLVAGYVDPYTKICHTSWDPTGDGSFSTPHSTLKYEILVRVSKVPSVGEPQYYWDYNTPSHPGCPDDFAEMGLTPALKRTSVKLARINFGASIIPGFLPNDPSYTKAIFGQNYYVGTSDSFSILCGQGFAWMQTDSTKSIPLTAIVVGHSSEQTPYYACMPLRTTGYNTHFVPGTIDPVSKYCGVPVRKDGDYDEIEFFMYYEILIQVYL